MEAFTVVDAVVAVVIVLSAILAYSRGLVREAMSIIGWIAAAVVAYIFAHQARPLIAQIPILKDYIGDSCELSLIASFAAVFAVALILVSIFTPLFASVVQRSALGGVDQALGFLFGVLRGVLLVAVAFVVYNRVVVDQSIPVVDNSRSAKVFASLENSLNENIPEDAPGWIVARYQELVDGCGGPSVGQQGAVDATGAKTLTPPATGN